MHKVSDVAPSLLAADFRFLDREIKTAVSAGINYLHFDVMDGDFVPNISFGLPVLKSLAGHYPVIFDVHVMIRRVKFFAPKFIAAGANILTFHYEALRSDSGRLEVIDLIHKAGGKAGISIKPKTSVDVLLPFLDQIDLVLIMSVEPGFGGQQFDSSVLKKIAFLRSEINRRHLPVIIEVDGGINDKTAPLVREAGADLLVAGSYLFGHDDFAKRLEILRGDNHE